MQELTLEFVTERTRAALERLKARVARRPGRWRRRMAPGARPPEVPRRGLATAA